MTIEEIKQWAIENKLALGVGIGIGYVLSRLLK